MFSNYQLQIIGDHNFSIDKKKKVIPNPGNKRKYKLHYNFLFKFRVTIKKNRTKY